MPVFQPTGPGFLAPGQDSGLAQGIADALAVFAARREQFRQEGREEEARQQDLNFRGTEFLTKLGTEDPARLKSFAEGGPESLVRFLSVDDETAQFLHRSIPIAMQESPRQAAERGVTEQKEKVLGAQSKNIDADTDLTTTGKKPLIQSQKSLVDAQVITENELRTPRAEDLTASAEAKRAGAGLDKERAAGLTLERAMETAELIDDETGQPIGDGTRQRVDQNAREGKGFLPKGVRNSIPAETVERELIAMGVDPTVARRLGIDSVRLPIEKLRSLIELHGEQSELYRHQRTASGDSTGGPLDANTRLLLKDASADLDKYHTNMKKAKTTDFPIISGLEFSADGFRTGWVASTFGIASQFSPSGIGADLLIPSGSGTFQLNQKGLDFFQHGDSTQSEVHLRQMFQQAGKEVPELKDLTLTFPNEDSTKGGTQVLRGPDAVRALTEMRELSEGARSSLLSAWNKHLSVFEAQGDPRVLAPFLTNPGYVHVLRDIIGVQHPALESSAESFNINRPFEDFEGNPATTPGQVGAAAGAGEAADPAVDFFQSFKTSLDSVTSRQEALEATNAKILELLEQ